MRIAWDARGINLYKGTGIGTYTENVLRFLINIDNKNEYNLYWCGENYEYFQKENTKITIASKKYHRFFEQHLFPYNLNKENIDVYHVPQNGIGLNESILCKKISTIHDLIPYVMPETVGKGYLLKFIKEMPYIVEQSNAIITVSEWSKKDILKFFPIDENKIYVTPLAADEKYHPMNKNQCQKYLLNKYNIDSHFILYIGGFSSRKNVKSIIDAFSNLYYSLNTPYTLVIVGAYRDDSEILRGLSNNLTIKRKIKFTGFAPDEDLPILYNGCDLFVYPSYYEGFGLPPLEAMSCGTPVITSNITSIPEVVGDAGILIDPYNETQLEKAMFNVLQNEDLRNDLSKKGLNRSKLFNWENTAKNTLKVYENVITAS